MTTLKVAKKETVTRWDYLSTFKPPQYLSLEGGTIFKIEKLKENSYDYDMVSKEFINTYGGAQLGALALPGGLAFGMGGVGGPGQFFGGGAMPAYPARGLKRGRGMSRAAAGGASQVRIKKIEKIYNCVIYEKFINEFKRMLKKYP